MTGLAGAVPLLIVAGWGVALLCLEAVARPRREGVATAAAHAGGWVSGAALFGVAVAAAALVPAWRACETPQPMFSGMLLGDRFALAFDALFLAAAALVLPLIGARDEDAAPGEAPALVLFAVAGMMLLAHAADLVTVFLGIETMSLPVYVLCATQRSPRAAESALKYFLLGAFATGFLLYGIVLLYGATGTTSLAGVAAAAKPDDPIALSGMLLLIVAFGFKVAAVPFHMWTPDVYEGAPTPVTAFMAAAVKAGGFAAVLRVLGTVFASSDAPGGDFVYGRAGWASILAWLAAATMIAGNVAALRQQSVKRMLAWSSIAHAGTLLIGAVAAGVVGAAARQAVVYYLAAYTVTTIGAFGVCAYLRASTLDDFAGLGSRRPVAALAMTLFLASLGGVPPTAGFFGKLLVFAAALENRQLVWLVVVGVATSVVSITYYLRVVVAMYLREPAAAGDATPSHARAAVALVAAAIAVLHLGLFPARILDLIAKI